VRRRSLPRTCRCQVVECPHHRRTRRTAVQVAVAERLGVDPRKPVTLLGVAALGEPDLLVEVEAVAVLA
jgi:enamine deaminase RidA (YjgF/YER057c/UK114 family)